MTKATKPLALRSVDDAGLEDIWRRLLACKSVIQTEKGKPMVLTPLAVYAATKELYHLHRSLSAPDKNEASKRDIDASGERLGSGDFMPSEPSVGLKIGPKDVDDRPYFPTWPDWLFEALQLVLLDYLSGMQRKGGRGSSSKTRLIALWRDYDRWSTVRQERKQKTATGKPLTVTGAIHSAANKLNCSDETIRRAYYRIEDWLEKGLLPRDLLPDALIRKRLLADGLLTTDGKP